MRRVPLGSTPLLSCLAGPAEALQMVRHMGVGLGRVMRQARPSIAEGVPKSLACSVGGFRPGLFLKLPLPTSCSLNTRAAARLTVGREAAALGLDFRIGVNVRLDWIRASHLHPQRSQQEEAAQ